MPRNLAKSAGSPALGLRLGLLGRQNARVSALATDLRPFSQVHLQVRSGGFAPSRWDGVSPCGLLRLLLVGWCLSLSVAGAVRSHCNKNAAVPVPLFVLRFLATLLILPGLANRLGFYEERKLHIQNDTESSWTRAVGVSNDSGFGLERGC
ncbi:uncharacterized protein EV422DRAFT_321314 [Fimicolochytrium jonesii]|uniref:uncharacterized protein n=1 Tax=Fimicolochytrium jonesii TaxID=1396493 RepID=UPI0022FDE75D|nr:uncharacterized protein EV422DRAFT_321314 [Fimicolochytrium jonesii]KAI8824456.1 hypothetical protein EV422DRAFT_321314 [Fimicolochytrium jonesii]